MIYVKFLTKGILLPLLMFIYVEQVQAQVNRAKWTLGGGVGFLYKSDRSVFPVYEKKTSLSLSFSPRIGFFFSNKFLAGGDFYYSFKVVGNFVNYPTVYGIGYFGRYYFMPETWPGFYVVEICNKCTAIKLKPYIGISHLFSNQNIENGNIVAREEIDIQKIRVEIGTAFKLRNNLFYEVSIGRAFFPNSNQKQYCSVNSLFQYYFGETTKDERVKKDSCNASIIRGVLSCFKQSVNKTHKQLGGIIAGTSLTYIKNKDKSPNAIEGDAFREYSWNINVATHISNRFRLGINTIQIFTKSPSEGKNNYYLLGAFVQYEPFSPDKKSHFLLETGLMYGNYATLEPYNPYPREGLIYLDAGVTFEWKLLKNIYIETGFNVYPMLNKINGKYSYTQYVLGLNYIIE